jgi:glycerol kinase
MGADCILAIDQGTSGTKTIIVNSQGEIIRKTEVELKSYFPKSGFVEQDPEQIYQNVLDSVRRCLEEFTCRIICCGISNQRETFLLWDDSGQPLCPAVVWQCKRSIEICERLRRTGIEQEIKERTGLIIDPYFSGTKLIWLYENNPSVKNAILQGTAFFGTVDSWLLFKLTKRRKHCTDYTNACRTLVFNLDTLDWDAFLIKEFGLGNLRLPEARPSSDQFGETDFGGLISYSVPITSMIGDSHAAAFGEGCFSAGTAKATLGTGTSILMNTESKRINSKGGMVSTICWSMHKRVDYALEGIIVTTGGSIKWLRDQLGLFTDSRKTEAMAKSVADNNGVYLIPAFSGLGAPHWRMRAKAAILNLTFDCNKNHIVRAALESIPYQIKDVITVMEQDSGIELKTLKVDGAVSANGFVVQFLADLLDTPVENVGVQEVSALGAAYLAGLQAGVFKGIDEIESLRGVPKRIKPSTKKVYVKRWYEQWQDKIEQIVL